eukprot:c6104_g1_i1.p1 GENE.c6104_g1_i1~~c6104_g1_i1.p1  ORF type:complete len:516 (+),score=90.78 c6104_g1_i1:119-1549(+)
MAGGVIHDGPPTQTGFVTGVFAFNLIIGVGALALPYSMNQVGWILGGTLIVAVGFLGYISATFVIEAIANTSALKSLQESAGSGTSDELSARPLVTSVAATVSYTEPEQQQQQHHDQSSHESRLFNFRHLELATMSDTLFPRWGQICFYFIICVYLYGDLAIYAVAVPKILHHVTHADYNLLLAIFSAAMGPWVFFNFQKTKFLQFATLITRNIALFSMIILTIRFIGQGKGTSEVRTFRPQGLSTAFGNIVYAFMCHHSIPSIIAPMKNKGTVNRVFLFTFVFVAAVYLLLTITAIYAFSDISLTTCATHPSDPCDIQKLFTDNFSSFNQQWLAEYLTLFPVFTLTSNFPLISITLRNNLKTLFQHMNVLNDAPMRQHYVCCLLSPFPPLLLAFAVHDVTVLVGVTGAYAGMFIMFIVPTCLVHLSRKAVCEALKQNAMPQHETRSPFTHIAWVYIILAFSSVSLVIITINQILK